VSFYDPTEHGGVTDLDLEQFFAEHPDFQTLAPIGPRDSDPAGEPDGGTEGSEPSSPEPSAPPVEPAPEEETPAEEPPAEPAEPESPAPEETPSDFLELEGVRYPQSQIAAAARFQQQLATDPNLQQLITNYLAGAPAQVEHPASPVGDGSAPTGPPPDLDLDDPSVAALYRLYQTQTEQLNQLQYGINLTANQQIESQRQQVASVYSLAAAKFGEDHGLDAKDVETLSRVGARMNLMESLSQGMDPITGTPGPKDLSLAFNRALEIAMYSVPEYRDREFRRSVSSQREEAQKRKLLGAVGGSSGSTPRTQQAPAPGTPAARREMVKEVAAMLNGDWSDSTAN